jgi:mannosyltransferase
LGWPDDRSGDELPKDILELLGRRPDRDRTTREGRPVGAVQTALPSAAETPVEAEPARRVRSIEWPTRLLPALVPGLLMLGIGLWESGHPVLSWDEVATMDVASRSPAQIWRLLHTVDAVFGPYYYLIHLWTSVVGNTVLDLRLPSIIAMAGSVAVAGELGRRLFTPLIGLVTGLLLCLLPNTSRYAAEARPYAFACFFSVLALLLLYRALERPGVLRWLGYGLAVAFVGLSHIVALTTLGAHVAVVGCHLWRTRSWRPAVGWGAAVAAALAVMAPVAWLGTGQQHEQLSWVAPLTVAALRASPGAIVGSVEAAWLLIGMAVLARWRPARHVVEVALAALVPLIVVAAVSILISPLWVARYVLIVLAPTALLAAVALVGPGKRRTGLVAVRVAVVLALVAFAALPGQRSVRAATAKNGSDYRGAASLIQRYQQPGDGVVYQARSRTLRAGTGYYLSRDPGKPRDLLLLRTAAENATLTADEYPDAAAHVRGVRRVWLLVTGSHSDPTTARPDLRTLLKSQYRRIGLWHLSRATLALFVLRT